MIKRSALNLATKVSCGINFKIASESSFNSSSPFFALKTSLKTLNFSIFVQIIEYSVSKSWFNISSTLY